MASSAPAPPPLPSPPFHHAGGLLNLRDIGGYPVAGQPGKITRCGLVYRSADPGKLTGDGVRTLQALGITHVYDLRSALELEKARAAEGWDKPKEWDGAARVFAPVFLNENYSPEALAVRFKDYSEGTEVRSNPQCSACVAVTCGCSPTAPGEMDRGYSFASLTGRN